MNADAYPIVSKKKLIEVALPLDVINESSAREKAIRRGHPSNLHPWWARRPLSAARAVIFAQMVDDPSANPDIFPTERAQEKERQRLFRIIEDLVQWENTTNEEVLQRAREEIWQSWRRACADNAGHPHAKNLFDRHVLPAFHDPFAGGGSLPLEAQRLGLEAHATDLNPVAVLINKAMIEIPPRFNGHPPKNPEARGERRLMKKLWNGAEGLAEDVRYYGRWMRDEAEKRIGHLYPKVSVTVEMASARPDLQQYVGRDLTVIAWLWARTVKSPNPAFIDVNVPLATTFTLSRKKGREAYVEPLIENSSYRFRVKMGRPPEALRNGTKLGRGGNFRCILSGAPIAQDYIRAHGKSHGLGSRLMAVVAKGDRGRIYLSPSAEQEAVSKDARPKWRPELMIPNNSRWFSPPLYGLHSFGDLFTDRQLVVLTTLSDLVLEARRVVRKDALAAGLSDDNRSLNSGGTGADAYADAIAGYLAFSVSKTTNRSSTLCTFKISVECPGDTFVRQALPMTWDYAEANTVGGPSGSFESMVNNTAAGLLSSGGVSSSLGFARVGDSGSKAIVRDIVASTDPPYYDNIGYSDLSDYFYVWLRRSLGRIFPDLFTTLATPKDGELVATPYRHGSKSKAERYFVDGMTVAMRNLSKYVHPAYPLTIYYAFKQSEQRRNGRDASTGWETFLSAVIKSGLSVSGTWPVRTERQNRRNNQGTNALASSIVLACRPVSHFAPRITRRQFQEALRAEFRQALKHLQNTNIAPVDLAQASIGPGMAIFTRYAAVLNADGSEMSVRDALEMTNTAVDEALAEQEGEFDRDTRWALTWFEQHGFAQGQFGEAEQLSKAKNTSVDGLVRAGFIKSSGGTVRLYEPDELQSDWKPDTDSRLTVWESTHYLIRALRISEKNASELSAQLGSRAEAARDLAYRLYTMSERKRRATDALQYNSLVQSWPEIARLARERPALQQESMLG